MGPEDAVKRVLVIDIEVQFIAGFNIKNLRLPQDRMETCIRSALSFQHLRFKAISYLHFTNNQDAVRAGAAVHLTAMLYHHKLSDWITVDGYILKLEGDLTTGISIHP